MWKDNLILDIEISTQCNAFCPQCARYEPGTETVRVLEDKWSASDFKSYFPSLDNISEIYLYGTRGDPATCNDLPEIIDYIMNNSTATVVVSSNGSLQTEEWWWRLAISGGERLTVAFDIDGTTQEMHARYRRNTNLEKILSNIEVVSNTKANIRIFTVVFKHNQDYLDDIFEMCKKFNPMDHAKLSSNRFSSEKPFEFTDRKGIRDTLEQATTDYRCGTRMLKDYRVEVKDNVTINCSFHDQNKLVILNDGKVYPCCFVSPHIPRPANIYTGEMSYLNNAESVKDKPLEEILKNDFYTRGIFESFKNPVYQCRKYCGS